MKYLFTLFATIFYSLFSMVYAQSADSLKLVLNQKFNRLKSSDLYFGDHNYLNGKKISLDTVYYNSSKDTLILSFSKSLAEMPYREGELGRIQDSLKSYLPATLKQVAVKILSNKMELKELVPNHFRTEIMQDQDRLTQSGKTPRKNVVSKVKPYDISAGLAGANIALWHSHGWYYEPKLDRWEWQRARLFTTLEDISPTAFVVPYIAPMLENAGATTFIPRERDWQRNELIVDNNGSSGKSKFVKPKNRKGQVSGFAIGKTPYTNENPFDQGTAIRFQNTKRGNNVNYIPDIPEEGDYGVYVSYAKGDGDVIYRVHHTGGITSFTVDQRMGYGTWVYLDRFRFKKGLDKKRSKVELIVPSGTKHNFSADAVRFGGGMGLIERNGKTGGRAKFFEGSRYFLQYSGAPDTLVWDLSEGKDDYVDDYMSRGEWVDWLMGNPLGPTKNRQHPGLNVSIDMAFAFHTDAGISHDGIIGTLGIYSTDRDTSFFANGLSKYSSRDLCDIVQSQIVEDINHIYNFNWTRRGMWNAQYSEAYRPQVPTMLLELLSHQNLNDVRFLLHPQFKFDVSRAIYKGMLKFIATQNGYDPIIQPLPVDHLAAELLAGNQVKLSWKPVIDKLEVSAVPKRYMVYQRTDENGFDNGTLVENNEYLVSGLQNGKVYGFRVTAINEGGESFPSEVISVGIPKKSKGMVMIVNGFDRIDGPAFFKGDSLSGVLRSIDHGVSYNYDMATTGDQYDFINSSVWLDDDSPGHGASYADLETVVFRGNTFDFSLTHGKSIMAAGYSFVTISDEVLEEGDANTKEYVLLDLLYGEEKASYLPGNNKTADYKIYNDGILSALEDYQANGGKVFISGAYIGSDIPKDKDNMERIGKLLGLKWRTNHASKSGSFYSVSDDLTYNGEFNTDYSMVQYPVEAPDGIEPFDKNGQTILRYSENNISAAVFYDNRSIALGFPFESIKGEKNRDEFMKKAINMLLGRNNHDK